MTKKSIYKTFWDTSSILKEEIPTIQDVLKSASKKRMVQTFISLEELNCNTRYSKKRKKQISKLVGKAVDDLRHLEITPSETYLVFPQATNEPMFGKTAIWKELQGYVPGFDWIDATLTTFEDLPKIASYASGSFSEFLEQYPKMNSGTYSMDFLSWEELASARVWLEGCRTVKDRYEFLAKVLYAATWFGFGYEEHKEEREEFMESIVEGMKEREVESEQYLDKGWDSVDYGFKPPSIDKIFGTSSMASKSRVIFYQHAEYVSFKPITRLYHMLEESKGKKRRVHPLEKQKQESDKEKRTEKSKSKDKSRAKAKKKAKKKPSKNS